MRKNHVSHLKNTTWDVYDAFGEAQHMIQTVNGKTVILTKVTYSLHTKINSLITSLNQVDSNFKQWKISLSKQFDKHNCYFNTYLEFFSKYSAELNRVLDY